MGITPSGFKKHILDACCLKLTLFSFSFSSHSSSIPHLLPPPQDPAETNISFLIGDWKSDFKPEWTEECSLTGFEKPWILREHFSTVWPGWFGEEMCKAFLRRIEASRAGCQVRFAYKGGDAENAGPGAWIYCPGRGWVKVNWKRKA